MITHSDDGPFWSVLKRGAEAAAADVGVTLVWQGLKMIYPRQRCSKKIFHYSTHRR